MKMVYIAGYGRSGSTLLERILGLHPQIQALGEFCHFFQLMHSPHTACACGTTIQNCLFWGKVIENFNHKLSNCEVTKFTKLQKRIESAQTISNRFSLNDSVSINLYDQIIGELLSTIKTSAFKEVNYFIDSSKTAYAQAYRPLALKRILNEELRVIHLVRDPRAVVWSVTRGSNRKLEQKVNASAIFPKVRAVVGWITANYYAQETCNKLNPEYNLLVRYEDFVKSPTTEIGKIGDFLKLDFNQVIETITHTDSIPTVHQLSGNRMRHDKKLIIQPDLEWQNRLSKYDQWFVHIATQHWMKKYSYE